ncbi:hypothetical protein ACK354_14585, partial [Aeromonas veronii]
CCCGSGILLNRLLESSLIFKGFSRLSTRLFALPLALSMEAHYREPRRDDKGFFIKKVRSLRYQASTSFFARNSINFDYCRI